MPISGHTLVFRRCPDPPPPGGALPSCRAMEKRAAAAARLTAEEGNYCIVSGIVVETVTVPLVAVTTTL